MAHEQMEDGVDRGAAVRLRIELPAWVRDLMEKSGAQVGEEGASIGPVITFKLWQGFNSREGFLRRAM